MLEIKELCFSYDKKNRILENLELQFAKNKISVILGKNGAGKSTLLKCIYGILKPDQGQIMIDGVNTNTLTYKQLAKNIAVLKQDSNYVFPYTALDMVLMGRNPHIDFFSTPAKQDLQKTL